MKNQTAKVAQKTLIRCTLLTVSVLSLFQYAEASSYQDVYDVVFKKKTVEPQTTDSPIEVNSDTQNQVTANTTANTTADTDIDTAIKAEQAVYAAGNLPAYQVTFGKFTKSVTKRLATRTHQTLVDKVDYYDRLEKLVHSNGICMAGTWEINDTALNANNQAYTGMFAKGASSLFIGRLSVALSETKQGEKQAFSLAGKIFGTNDVKKEVVTESFFVGDVLSGIKRDSVFSAPMSSNPQVKFRFSVIPLVFKIGGLFGKADKKAGIRPVTGIARMGHADANANINTTTYVSPKYLLITPLMPQGHTTAQGIDFRDEFALSTATNAALARNFTISVSDIDEYDSKNVNNNNWQKIGTITANETIVSYGCDRQLHFAHPKSE